MNSLDLIRMAVKNLFRRKLRTCLTIFAIVIGTISIVLMMSLGIGMKQNYEKEINKMGSLNIIDVRASHNNQGGIASGARGNTQSTLNDKSVETISQIQGVEVVTPLLETSLKLVSKRYLGNVQVVGINPEDMKKMNFKIKDGRLLKTGDKFNMVFGSEVPYQFYNPSSNNESSYGNPEDRKENVNVLTDKITMSLDMNYGEKVSSSNATGEDTKTKLKDIYKIKGVGILSDGGYSNNYNVFIPIKELKTLKTQYEKSQSKDGGSIRDKQKGYSRLMVKVANIKDVKQVQQEIKSLGFETESLTDFLESTKKTTNIIQLVMGGIGGVSLFVAAIGIANTMVMSIYERRKEIGVMKVIGASVEDIRRLFLLESALIGLIGGLIGVAISFLLSVLINTLVQKFSSQMFGGDKISHIPLLLILFSLFFTTIVGILAGFLPARKATKLSALEAIKTE